MKKREFNKKRERIIDIVLLAILAGLMGLLLYYVQGYLPSNKFYPILIIFAAIFLVFLLALFLRTKKLSLLWIKRSFMIVLCVILGLGSYYIGISDSTLRNLADDTNTREVLIISKENSTLKSEDDLNNKKIGIQTLTHTNISTFAQEELSKNGVTNPKYEEGMDFPSLYEDLQGGKIDALVISRSDFNNLRKQYEDIDSKTKTITSYKMDIESETSVASDLDITKEVFTVLISGLGETDVNPNENELSDTNILMMVDPISKHIELLSIPRDAYIPNPQYGYANDKLTHLSADGISNLEEGIELALGIEIDFYVKLNFLGAVQLVDAIGGIDVDVAISFEEQDEHRSFAPEDMIRLEAGFQTLNGKEAVAYARHRKSYTDIDRGKAQQQIIAAALAKVTSPSGITKIPELLKLLPDTVATNMPYPYIKAFAANEIETAGKTSWSVHSINFENWTSDLTRTASAPGMDLSVVYLSLYDATKIYNIYYAMSHPSPMKDFSFNANDLTENMQPFTPYPTMVWAETATPGSTQNQTPEYEQEQPNYYVPETPEVPVQEEEVPVTPPIEEGPQTPPEEEENSEAGGTPETPETPTNP